jgi:hypothetical protein
MPDTKLREVAESLFDRDKRQEAEINDALKQEEARHAAVLKKTQRLAVEIAAYSATKLAPQ